MDVLTTLRTSKRVGILISSGLSIFSSGLVQNAYFIYQCFAGLGIVCDFLTIDENPKPFDYKNIPLKVLGKVDFKEYHTILTISTGLTKQEYDLCVSNKVSVISFICGNQFMHDSETFVSGKGKGTFIGKGSHADELWVIPCYKFALKYFETIRGKPAFIVPHLWSPCILEDAVKTRLKREVNLLTYTAAHITNKLALLIAEPNIALFKNSWLPLVTAEHLHLKQPTLIDSVNVFNWPDTQQAAQMADVLTLGSRLRRFKRVAMAEVFTDFNSQSPMPIFVSHQIHNTLNYLYYECLYFGFPLVHNSPDLEGCGYYYPENDMAKCAEMILYAQNNHNSQLIEYIAKGRRYLERVDPLNSCVSRIWKQYIDSVLAKYV